ncbi:hypothetical protein [Pseudodesulfovibrio piezophilus]|uniref:Uncharacterized protein n=1 Tax=Pseudodesulfovibrio piezophilus (strain DSM 21447 / JCM 15486 / C1TLV30) TaxID=1322246 RepID=M1WNN3_PSEP2|nr:hypothetical protein [Pseudodesulfovibrio piezophilus]CCH50460.1 protein of unknown function [Pseudodesulfovibrio piezophilus C1TLV30]
MDDALGQFLFVHFFTLFLLTTFKPCLFDQQAAFEAGFFTEKLWSEGNKSNGEEQEYGSPHQRVV